MSQVPQTNTDSTTLSVEEEITKLHNQHRNNMQDLSTQLTTNEMPSGMTVEARFNQIANNFTVGKKAIYLVCRDLFKSQQELGDPDYEQLIIKLESKFGEQLSRSTAYKFESIGRSHLCAELFMRNKLPLAWTTQYEIAHRDNQTKIMPEDKVLLKEMVSEKSTMKEVLDVIDADWEVVEDDKNKKDPVPTYAYKELIKPVAFIQIAVDKDGADSAVLEMIKKKVQAVIDDYDKDTFKDYVIDSSYQPCSVEMSVKQNQKEESYLSSLFLKNYDFCNGYEKNRDSNFKGFNAEKAIFKKYGLSTEIIDQALQTQVYDNENPMTKFKVLANEYIDGFSYNASKIEEAKKEEIPTATNLEELSETQVA